MNDIFPYGFDSFLENQEKKRLYTKIISEKEKSEREKLDGKPMYTASSWI